MERPAEIYIMWYTRWRKRKSAAEYLISKFICHHESVRFMWVAPIDYEKMIS